MGKYLIKERMATILIIIFVLVFHHVNVEATNSDVDEAKEPEPVVIVYYEDGTSKKYPKIDDDLLDEFESEINSIISKPQKWIKSTNSNMVFGLSLSTDVKIYNIKKYENPYESYILIDNQYYEGSSNLDELVTALIESDTEVYMEPDERLLTYTYECEEPVTDDEYIEAAVEIVGQWLDSLMGETGKFKLDSYSFIKNRQVNECELLADGYIDGAREWAVDVRFDVEGIPENSVFADDPADNSGYNTFYHYYFGPCVIVRLRWENGFCTVVGYDSPYIGATYSGHMIDDLYGIQNEASAYPTFYELMNDRETVNTYLTNGIGNQMISDVVSHNVTMLSDGRMYYIDIDSGTSYNNSTFQEDGFCYGQMVRRFYDEDGNTTYSSPVSYNDEKMEPYELKFKQGFELLFDDYNNDGNPDYTIKIDEDENGSTYSIDCMSNDGTPRANPYGVEIYMAGTFEDSIRLQRYEDGYVIWRLDSESNEMVANTELEDYRMYSQRYYEPEPLCVYEPETAQIVCYFWNNTKDSVTCSDKYSIEKYTNGNWETVAENLTCEGEQVEAYGNSALKFDVSSVQETICYEYRIVLEVTSNDNIQTVYGSFYMGNPNERVENSTGASENGGQWYYFADNPIVEKDETGNLVLTLENGIGTRETAKHVSIRGLSVLEEHSWEEIYDYDTFIDGMDGSACDVPYGASIDIILKKYENSSSSFGLDLNIVMSYIWVRFPAVQCDNIVKRFELTIGINMLDFLELDSEAFAEYLFWVTAFDNKDDSDSEILKSGDKCRLEIGVEDYVEYVYFEME